MPLVPYALTRPFLFGLDAEHAHELTLNAIASLQNTPAQCLWSQARVDDPVTVAGLKFPNRVGLAAGLDKNGRCIDGFGAMGFGFIEVGTVTPKAQPGNPKPRMFRLPEARALINRLGFNNDGRDALLGALQQRKAALAKEQRRAVPMFVKIAPDLDHDQIKLIAATLKKHGIDGVIATNTTIARDTVQGLKHADEAGGLSGAPVFDPSNRVIGQLRGELGAAYPIIGVGGVMSGADARAM